MSPSVVRRWYPVAGLQEIPLNEGRRIQWKDCDVALFNIGGEFLATDNRCPHKQGPLADGLIAGKAVFCPLHNWKISLESGCALSGGVGQVKTYPVKVINDYIHIAFEEGKCSDVGAPLMAPGDEGVINHAPTLD